MAMASMQQQRLSQKTRYTCAVANNVCLYSFALPQEHPDGADVRLYFTVNPAWDMLQTYHTLPAGVASADEGPGQAKVTHSYICVVGFVHTFVMCLLCTRIAVVCLHCTMPRIKSVA